MHAEMHISLQVICYSFLTQTGIYQQILVKLPNIILNENTFSSSSVAVCGQTDRYSEAYECIFATCYSWFIS
jgi:ABC-type multidrug transport system permease subunit